MPIQAVYRPIVRFGYLGYTPGSVDLQINTTDREDLPTSVVKVVLTRIPGIRLANWHVLNSNAIFSCRRGGISARIWVDGVSVDKELIQNINIDDVVAIEVYQRLADIPAQYNSSADQSREHGPSFSSAACGVVLIWTKA